MCGHLNLKLASSSNVKSIFSDSQSSSFLVCTSVREKKKKITVVYVLICFIFNVCLLQASIQYHTQQASRDYFINIIQANDGVQLKNYWGWSAALVKWFSACVGLWFCSTEPAVWVPLFLTGLWCTAQYSGCILMWLGCHVRYGEPWYYVMGKNVPRGGVT